MPQKYLLIFFSAMLLFSSCVYPTMYYPRRANSPGFTTKGEFKAVAGMKTQAVNSTPNLPGSQNFASSYLAPEFTGAYALTNHVAITAGYTSVLDRYTTEGQGTSGYYGLTDSTVGGLVNLQGVEVGGGYFAKSRGLIKYGLYGSLGVGNITRKGLILPEFDYRSKFWRWSVQPEFGIHPNEGKLFSATAGARLTGINYYGFRSDNPLTKYAVGFYNPRYPKNVTNGMHIYIEPYANLEVGYKYLKFNVQLGVVGGLTQGANVMASPLHLGLGVVFHFHPDYH